MTYVYKCPFCGEQREHTQPITAEPARLRCPRCKASQVHGFNTRAVPTMRRVISGGAGFRLLGKDWTSKGRA